MSQIIFVGESNPYGSDPRFALYHLPREASGNRLREHVGLFDHTYEPLTKVNLCAGRWQTAAARGRAVELARLHPVIVALGRKVGQAFTVWDFFTTTTIGEARVVLLPHPSGLNRMWDDPRARGRARELLRREAPAVPWGEVP